MTSPQEVATPLTVRQAYESMILYLERFHYPRFDQVGVIIGELKFQEDGVPGDPAAWDDWQECVQQVVSRHDEVEK